MDGHVRMRLEGTDLGAFARDGDEVGHLLAEGELVRAAVRDDRRGEQLSIVRREPRAADDDAGKDHARVRRVHDLGLHLAEREGAHHPLRRHSARARRVAHGEGVRVQVLAHGRRGALARLGHDVCHTVLKRLPVTQVAAELGGAVAQERLAQLLAAHRVHVLGDVEAHWRKDTLRPPHCATAS